MGKIVLAIDPGPISSALVVWDGIAQKGFLDENRHIKKLLLDLYNPKRILVIEEMACYGMAVGASVFQSVFWSGRFAEAWGGEFVQIKRMEVKMHLCHNSRAKDTNIRQALIDRFGLPGTKRSPGVLFGLRKDLWQAMALAVTYFDRLS